MPGIFRTQTSLIFVDEDNRELGRVADAALVPRAGDNVRLKDVPYVVERIGFDVVGDAIERVFAVCRRA